MQRFQKLAIIAPLSPRRERAARKAATTISQSVSVICVSMIGSPKPTSYESPMPPAVNPLFSTHPIPSTRPRKGHKPGAAYADNVKALRDREIELARHAEHAYERFVSQWQPRGRGKRRT